MALVEVIVMRAPLVSLGLLSFVVVACCTHNGGGSRVCCTCVWTVVSKYDFLNGLWSFVLWLIARRNLHNSCV